MRHWRVLVGVATLVAMCWFPAPSAQAETYYYDVLNRLTKVISDDASPVTTYYCYDPAGNRTYVGTTVCTGGGGQQFFAQMRTGSPLAVSSDSAGAASSTAVVPSTTQPPAGPSTPPAQPLPGS